MAFDPTKEISQTGKPNSPFMLFYGKAGVGKTSLACEFPSPILINLEMKNPLGVEIDQVKTVTHDADGYEKFLDVMAYLENGKHNYKTFIIDSLDFLEQNVIVPRVCNEFSTKAHDVTDVEEVKYGKGHNRIHSKWLELLRVFRRVRSKTGMCGIFLGHLVTKNEEDHVSDVDYKQVMTNLAKQTLPLIEGSMDSISLLKTDIYEQWDKSKRKMVAKGDRAVRWIYTDGDPTYVAKNPYDFPTKIKYELGKGFEVLRPYIVGEKGRGQLRNDKRTEPTPQK